MQTQAIGANLTPNFTARRHSRENIDNFINADDKEIRDQARAFSNEVTEHKKHKKISNAMFASVPLVAGLASAVLTKGNSTFLSKPVSGAAAKLGNGIRTGAVWSLLLGSVALVGKVNRELSKDNDSVRNFNANHPFLSFVASVTTAALTVMAATKGISYAASKIKPSSLLNIRTKVGKAANAINNNSVVKSASKKLGKLKSKLPAPLKSVAKVLISWAPDIMLVGGIFHNINHEAKRGYVFSNAYSAIKDKQLELSRARMAEMGALPEETEEV